MDLLKWLKRRQGEARAELEEADWDDERWVVLNERVQTYSEVIQHISFGTP